MPTSKDVLLRRRLKLPMYVSSFDVFSHIYNKLVILGLKHTRSPVTNLLKGIAFLSIISVCSAHVVMGEQCDWTGSGLEMSGGRWTGMIYGITPVYLRCSQGRVSWVYPRGGLRVVLRFGSSGNDFTGCIKVNPTFAGARIFQENEKILKELFSPNDSLPVNLARCFHSRTGQAALYIEAAAPSSSLTMFPKYLAEFSYDLETVPKNSFDPQERCRPCDKEELLRAFCTNDLVISGSIEGIQKNAAMDDSEIIVHVEKILKYSLFEAAASDVERLSKLNKNKENDEDKRSQNGNISENEISDHHTVSIMMPKICQSKPGIGQFVFMLRKRFDEYSLVCAPRWQDWRQLVWQENQKGNAHCVLSY